MDPSAVLPQPGQLVGRKYRIVSRVGAGGMGVVFEAVHVDTDGRVALKWLNPDLSSSPEAVERFKLEARATGRIRHPNVVAIHDIGEHEGHLYLVMEFLTGGPLRTRIMQGPLEPAEACSILFPVMRGMAAAHAAKILHRDLKPDNIFLAESPDGLEPLPKVLDFGIAKLCSDSEQTGSASARTAMMGTYQYMALEQLHGRRDLDERVDVYALGAVLYNMLTGRLPYQADNPVDLALQMLQGPPLPVTTFAPGVSQGMAQVIAQALSREREQRYPSVEAFALALEPFAFGSRLRGPQGARSSAAEPSLPGPPSSPSGPASVPPLRTPFLVEGTDPGASASKELPPRRRRLPWAASALAVLGLGAGYAWYANGGGQRDVSPSAPAQQPAAQSKAPAATGLHEAEAPRAASPSDDWASNEPVAPAATPPVAASPTTANPASPPTSPVAREGSDAGPQVQPRADEAFTRADSTRRKRTSVAAQEAGASARERVRSHAARASDAGDGAEQAPAQPAPAPARGLGDYGGLDMTDLPRPSWAGPNNSH